MWLLGVSAFGCANKEEKKAKHLAAAKEYIEKSEYHKAVIELKNAVKLDPKDDEAYCNGVEYCDAGSCNSTFSGSPPDQCSPLTCDEDNDLCLASDVTLTIENTYGREGVIPVLLDNSSVEVSEVHLEVCDVDQRSWLHISTSTDGCSTTDRTTAATAVHSQRDFNQGRMGAQLRFYGSIEEESTAPGPRSQLSGEFKAIRLLYLGSTVCRGLWTGNFVFREPPGSPGRR